MVSRGVDPQGLSASGWSQEYCHQVFFADEVVKAGQGHTFIGACGHHVLAWARKNGASLSPITGKTYDPDCRCDLCLHRERWGSYAPEDVPLPAGQEWMITRLPQVVEEKVVEDNPESPELGAKDEEDNDEVQGEKLSKAAKRKKRKRTLETFLSKLQ